MGCVFLITPSPVAICRDTPLRYSEHFFVASMQPMLTPVPQIPLPPLSVSPSAPAPSPPVSGGSYALPPLPTPSQLLYVPPVAVSSSVPVSQTFSSPPVAPVGRQLNIVSSPSTSVSTGVPAVVPAMSINSTAVYTAPVYNNATPAGMPVLPTTVNGLNAGTCGCGPARCGCSAPVVLQPNGWQGIQGVQGVPNVASPAVTGGTATSNTTINLPPNAAPNGVPNTTPNTATNGGISQTITQNGSPTAAPLPQPQAVQQPMQAAPQPQPLPPAAMTNGVKESATAPPEGAPNLGLPQDTYPLTREMVDRWSRVLDGPPSSTERPGVAREIADFLLAHPEVTLEGKPRAIMERLVTNLLSTGRTGTDSGMTNSVERDMILLALSNGGFYNLPDSIVSILQQLAASGTGLHGMEQNLAQGIINQHQRGKDRPAAALLQAYEQRWPAWDTNEPVPTREAPEMALQSQAYQGIQQGMQAQPPPTGKQATPPSKPGWLGRLLGLKPSQPKPPSGTQPLSLRQPGQPNNGLVTGPDVTSNPFAAPANPANSPANAAAAGWPAAGGPLSASWNSLMADLPAGNAPSNGSIPLTMDPLASASLTGPLGSVFPESAALAGDATGISAMSQASTQGMPNGYDQWLTDWMASQGDGQVANPFTEPLPEIPGMTG